MFQHLIYSNLKYFGRMMLELELDYVNQQEDTEIGFEKK